MALPDAKCNHRETLPIWFSTGPEAMASETFPFRMGINLRKRDRSMKTVALREPKALGARKRREAAARIATLKAYAKNNGGRLIVFGSAARRGMRLDSYIIADFPADTQRASMVYADDLCERMPSQAVGLKPRRPGCERTDDHDVGHMIDHRIHSSRRTCVCESCSPYSLIKVNGDFRSCRGNRGCSLAVAGSAQQYDRRQSKRNTK